MSVGVGGPAASTLVRGAHVLSGFRADDEPVVIADGAICVQAGIVASIGPFHELRAAYPDAPVVGGPDQIVIPGLINAHHHVGLTPFQLGSPDHPLELWFASRIALRDVDLYLDTLYSAFEMLSSGVTTVQHLHSRVPGNTDADLVAAGRTVMRAYRDVGMRASYSMAMRDQNRLVYEADQDFVRRLPDELRPVMTAYFERFTLRLDDQLAAFSQLYREQENDPLVRVQIAPSNLHWLSDDGLQSAAELARRTGAPMHMHLLETPYQKAYAAKRAGGSAFAHIHRFGLTGPQLTIGHGVWMSDKDIALCADTGTRLCHNCSSNLRLKSGVAPINRFLARQIQVAIGIDEAGINDDRDMLQEMRMVLQIHREPGIDAPNPTPAAVLRMATENGAKTTPFAGSVGSLSPGQSADLVVINWKAVTYPYQSTDLPVVDVLVQRATKSAVEMVMIGGEVIYRDGRFMRVDRDQVLSEIAARLSGPLTPAEEDRRFLAAAVMPHVRRFYDGYLEGPSADPHYRMNDRT